MLLSRFLELIRRERLLFKLVSSFLAASVVSVVLVSSILFAAYNRRGMEDLASVTQMTLANTVKRLEQTFTQSANVAFFIFKDPDVVSLMYSEKVDPLNLVRVSAFVQNLMISNPYIHSVSLCGRDKVLLGTSQSGDFQETPESILGLARLPKVLTPRPRRVESAHGNPASLLTLTINESNSPSYVDSAVVLNLDADAIRRDLSTDAGQVLLTVIVVDAAGTVLLDSDGAGFATSITTMPYAERLAGDPRATGFFLAEVGNRRYTVSFARAQDGRYIAISLTDFAQYTAGISGLRNILLAASGGILFLVLVFGLFLSLRLYIPLNALFDGIRSRISAHPGPKSNELEYVSRIMARALDAFSAAEQDAGNDRVVVSALLRDLLAGPAALDSRVLEEELRRRNVIPDKPGRFAIAVMRVDGFAALRERASPEAVRIQMASIGGVAEEALKSRMSCIPAQTADDAVTLVMFVPDVSVRWWHTHAKDSLRGVQGAVRKMFGLSMTVGLGGELFTMAEIRASYGKVEALTRYRLVFSQGALLTASDVTGFKDEPLDTRGVEDAFRSLTRSNDRGEFASAVDSLVLRCRGLRIDRQMEGFAAAARAVLTSAVGIASHETDALGTARIDSTLRGMESYDDLKTWLLTLYDAYQKALRELGASRSADFLQKAIDFIDKNFADCQLSANMLAERLAISPQYFSRLFNESVKASFPEYLMTLRLEKARTLLLSTPKLTVGEICRRIGLNNRTYFATAFKKRFGVSPATFRQAGSSASLSV